MNHHPTKATLTQADFDAWPNCAVADCEAKVTHDSDKCYPHTHGWGAVRKNLRDRIDRLSKQGRTSPVIAEIAYCRSELKRIEGFK